MRALLLLFLLALPAAEALPQAGAQSSASRSTASQSSAAQDATIDLNRASVEELMRLPGIGRALAERIVEHRRKHGPFRRAQDVVIVRGMSARRYRQIAHLVRTS